MDDVLGVLRRPTRVEAYAGMPQHGGSCWRFIGRDLDLTRRLAVGVGAYLRSDGGAAILCTVIDLEPRRR